MTEDELVTALQIRILTPELRVDSGGSKPPLYPPVSPETVASAEAELGLAFPPLLSRLYCEVANGGFGPAFGMLGLSGGHTDADGRTLVDVYKDFRKEGAWPKPLLPLWDWSFPAWSCVDTRSAQGRIVTEDAEGATMTGYALHSWLEAWVNSVKLYEKIYTPGPQVVVDFGGGPSGTNLQGPAIGVPIDFPEEAK